MTKNDTPANRARNRRVEIILQQGEDKPSGDDGISGKKPLTGKAGDLPSRTGQRQTRSKPAVAKARPEAKPRMGIKAGGH
jgi:hypothetical protein